MRTYEEAMRLASREIDGMVECSNNIVAERQATIVLALVAYARELREHGQ